MKKLARSPPSIVLSIVLWTRSGQCSSMHRSRISSGLRVLLPYQLLKSGLYTSLRRPLALFLPSRTSEWGSMSELEVLAKAMVLLFPVLVTCAVHSPVEGAKRRRFLVVHAMGDWLQRPQVSKHSRQVLVRQVAEH